MHRLVLERDLTKRLGSADGTVSASCSKKLRIARALRLNRSLNGRRIVNDSNETAINDPSAAVVKRRRAAASSRHV